MVSQQNGILMVAVICLLYDLQPADLESLPTSSRNLTQLTTTTRRKACCE
jgi:hypothetical protein